MKTISIKETSTANEINSAKEKREQQIIAEIEKAKYCIWLADTWFYGHSILEALTNKVEHGLNVEIIITKTQQDTAQSPWIQQFVDAGGELFFVEEANSEQFKYEKFCIIDFKTVILGNEKPTKSTTQKSNGQQLSIFKNFNQVTTHYTDEFSQLKRERVKQRV